jgi:hypothetical protein
MCYEKSALSSVACRSAKRPLQAHRCSRDVFRSFALFGSLALAALHRHVPTGSAEERPTWRRHFAILLFRRKATQNRTTAFSALAGGGSQRLQKIVLHSSSFTWLAFGSNQTAPLSDSTLHGAKSQHRTGSCDGCPTGRRVLVDDQA